MSAGARRALSLLVPHHRRVGLAIGLQAATVGAGVGLMATSAWLVSTAALHPSIAALQVAVVGVRFFGISRGLLRYLERLVSHDVTLRILERLRVDVFRALSPLAPARLVSQRSGDLLQRLLGDVDVLEQAFVRIVAPAAGALVVAGLAAVLLARYGAAAPVVAVAGLVLAGAIVPWLAWRTGRLASARAVPLLGDLRARIVDAVQGVADLVVFGRTGSQADDIRTASVRLATAQVGAARSAALGGALAGFTADLTLVAVLAAVIPRVAGGSVDGVHLAVAGLLALAAFEAVAGLPAAVQALGATREAAGRLFELTDLEPAVPDRAPAAARPDGVTIAIRGLRFTYPGEATPALEDVSVSIDRGRLVAVVGSSGSGKSTLAHLLLRFWDVPAGAVWLDGRDIRDHAPSDVRRLFAFAAQRVALLTGTIRDNLCLARAEASDADLDAAARDAGLLPLVAALPDGYDTWVGEHGLHLAGGERQRLALARAFLSQAPFLLLDEPTANVDAIAERRILAAIRRRSSSQGTLLITHRLAGLDAADEIIVLADARVIERGTYADLVTRAGWFARMLDLQREAAAIDAAWR
jgi:ATP-binding cassette subfamily C protein CydC